MNQQQRLVTLGILALLVLLVYGSSYLSRGDSGGRIGVSGSVTCDGQPIDSGRLQFSPDSNTSGPAISANIVNGAYTLAPQNGLLPGVYEVTMSVIPQNAMNPSERGSFPGSPRELASHTRSFEPMRLPQPQQIPAGQTDVELNFDFTRPKGR